jgi:hypothetical protein
MNRHFLKKTIDMFLLVRYDFDLNGYSLIPSWRRDRPNEAQQPANEKNTLATGDLSGQRC